MAYIYPGYDSIPWWHCQRIKKYQLFLWSLQAKPSLKTFYVKGAEEAAFENYKSDRIARIGMKGQGVYTVAQN